jgi:signal transduction histidine kinase
LSRTAAAFDLIAGLSILAAACVALLDQASAAVGRLAFAAGIVWFAQDWEGWTNGPAVVRSLAAAAVPLLVVPASLLASGARSRPVRLGSAFLCLVALLRSLVRDPLFDPHCWRDCVSRSLVVHSAPGLTRALDDVWLGTTVALGAFAVVVATQQLSAATWPARRALAPVAVPAGAVCVAVAAYAAALLQRPLEGPGSGVYSTLFYARAVAFSVLAVGIVVLAVRRRRQRLSLGRLTDELGAVPDALAAAFGDPTLQIAYWLPDRGLYVDADGRPVEVSHSASGRTVTPIVRGGRPVAVVSHDASFSVSPQLGSAARLALENERLQAELRAQVEALRRSRMRITERGDAERRRLERDLHDGAQQRLLALSFDLRLARSSAEQGGEERVVGMLDNAIGEVHAALEELRDLAHGIYPAILGEAGLAAALATLADDAPLSVELQLAAERYDAPVEAAMYVAVREALEDAVRRGAAWMRVRLDGHGTLIVDDDGEPRSEPLVHVADRVGALGGETEFGENDLRAVIPCG